MNLANAAPMATFALCLIVCGVGVAMALAARNLVKRVGGLGIAILGAALTCAALGASALAVALCVSLAATTALGAAISVRIAEEHGGGEAVEHDQARASETR